MDFDEMINTLKTLFLLDSFLLSEYHGNTIVLSSKKVRLKIVFFKPNYFLIFVQKYT